MSQAFPTTARAVIVGGGIVGCSVAYHLAKLGWHELVLLEQAKLSGGTTWHAAGLVGRLRTSNSMTQINKYSAELYAKLAAETSVPDRMAAMWQFHGGAERRAYDATAPHGGNDAASLMSTSK